MPEDNAFLYHYAIGKILSSNHKKDNLHLFKNSLDYNTLCHLTDGLSSSIEPFKFTIYGNALPKTLEDLGKCDVLFKPQSVDKEIQWVLLSIRKYSKELSIFVLLKMDFEQNFLLGNYDKAERILEIILKETGYSLWYIESKFLLLEYQNKSEEQKEFLSEINEKNKNGLVGSLAHFLSFRTERNLSAYKYDSDINTIFKLNKNKQEKDSREYYLYRLNFFENYSLPDYSHIAQFENYNSIIDRYLVVRELLKVLSLDEKNAEFVYNKARYIYRKTEDEYLLSFLFKFDQDSKNEKYFDKDYLRILDLYYTGLYEDAITECLKYLIKKKCDFDLIIIYVRCHINLKKEVLKLTDESNSLLNQLSAKIFYLISNKNNRTDLLYNLYQINKNILSFNIAAGLDFFLKREQNYSVNKKLKLLSISHFDPYFSQIFSKKEEAVKYLDNSLRHYPKAVSTDHWLRQLQDEIPNKETVSDERFAVDKAKLLFKQNSFEESIIEWQQIILRFSENPPIIQTALKYWFQCLIMLESYNEAIKLFVEYYLLNHNSVNKIITLDILSIMRKGRYKGIKRTIDLPVFVNIVSSLDTEKSFILEQFCKIYSKTKPSELFDGDLDSNPLKVENFYNDVCNSETLKHSIYLNTTIDRLTERLRIINHLIESFPQNIKLYQEELNLISNELIIYEGTQKLEESKIYANDQAIINYELNEIEGLYNRFKTIYSLSMKNKKILLITKDSFALLKFNENNKYDETEVKYTESALLEVFSELFDSILDKYLFSKFGIVAYLSTRIRHGVLLGEIRPEFEKQNLILNRIGSSSSYEESKYWSTAFFGLSTTQKIKLHAILNSFSLNVDTMIEDIVRDRIQIKKDGKNENGLFNYEFDKTELYSYAIELAMETDARTFSQKVIDLIWRRTDANLEVIRAYIDHDIKNKFSEELNNLDKQLRLSFTNAQLPQIFTNVMECSTVIENKLKKISSWFRRSGSSINDFDIQKVFNIVWVNTERCYPKVFAECNIALEMNPIIKSNYYIHFTDLFRILLDNMFKYGLQKEEKKYFEFKGEVLNGFLICTFTNLRSLSSDLPVTTKDGELMIDINKLISEGKSGISKAIKIVKFDLDSENNFIKILQDDPNQFSIEVSIELKNLLHNEKNSDS